MRMRSAVAAVLLSLTLGACDDGTAPPASPPSGTTVAAPARASTAVVTPMPGGGEAIAPPIGDVSSLVRQPDGRWKRVCARPSDEQRAAMENAYRANRQGRR